MYRMLYKSCTIFFLFFLEWANLCFFLNVIVKIHIFVLHVITILYTQFVFSSMEKNKMRIVM